MPLRLLISFTILLMSGCTFHSSQLEAARSVLGRPQVLPEHYWLLQLPEQTIPLVAVVDNPPVTTYVNAEGISISHNGRDITFVAGWPEGKAEIRISRADDILTYSMSDGSAINARCTDWVLVSQFDWQSDCQSVTGPSWSYQNEVQIDESGRIVRMHYAIWPGLSAVDLVWFPVSGESPSILPDL